MTGDSGSERSAGEGEPRPYDSAGEQPAPSGPRAGPPGPATDVDIAGWLQAAWRLFARDIPLAIGVGLVAVVPLIVLFLVGYFGMIALAILSTGGPGPPPAASIALGAAVGLLTLGVGLTLPALQAGAYACFLEGIRTGRLTSDSLWRGFGQWWPCTWVSWLLGAGALICLPFAFVLVGIPVILGLATLGWLSLFHIVDRGEGGVAALSFAWRVMSRRLWAMLVSTLLTFTLASGGAMAMYIGVVVTVPLAAAALAAGYDALAVASLGGDRHAG